MRFGMVGSIFFNWSSELRNELHLVAVVAR